MTAPTLCRLSSFVALLFASLVAVSPGAIAQETGRVEGRQANGGGYYVNYRPGEPTTRVSVWGAIPNPGVYEVGPDIDLETVISLAGGPVRERSATNGNTDPLDMVVRLYRGDTTEPVYSASLDAFISDEADRPTMRDGDVIEIVPQPVARITVWGSVNAPGLYEVGEDYEIDDVLSLAGGPTLRPLPSNVRRTVTITLYRASGTAESVYRATLEEFVRNPAGHPDLQDGDVIEVETQERNLFTYRDVLTIVGVAASATFAFVQLLRAIE